IRQQHHRTPEETAAARERLTQIARAPALSKQTLWHRLQTDLARGRTPAEPRGQPMKQAEARVVPRQAALPAAPGEKPVASRTGAGPGFIGPQITGSTGPEPLRLKTPDELAQIHQQAVATGDTATAA